VTLRRRRQAARLYGKIKATEEIRDAAFRIFLSGSPDSARSHPHSSAISLARSALRRHQEIRRKNAMAVKIAKTADRKKVMDTTKSTDCPKCGKATRIVKRVKDRERGVPGGIYISCSACEFFEKL
jgi:DNA-directed RNA polymerase subunit M/transcription elongation factor TFIIS